MNLLIALIDSLESFVKRNPLFCICLLTLAILAPSLLKGMAAFMLYLLLGLLLFGVVSVLLLRWRFARMQREVQEEFRRRAGAAGGAQQQPHNGASREGTVRIHITSETPEKRIADDVGDYVDFEETKQEKH